MRIPLVVALLTLSACAVDKLATAPPPGVDFSGLWRLNEAESDDPLHLLQSQNAAATAAPSPGQDGQGGQSGRGGRGGRAGGGFGGPGAAGPAMPPFSELNEGLKWPAKDVEVKQAAGSVTIASAGVTEVCRPGAVSGVHERPKRPPGDGPSRDMPARDRGEGPPPTCGWDDKTLVVQTRDSDDEGPPFVQRYSVSEDRRRLIEIVTFRGGRSGGFSLSRVWDRVSPDGTGPSNGADARR
jgi:hypothetical protein